MIEWKKDLIKKLKMEVLLGPFAAYSDMENNRGLTIISAISTSSITAHFWDEVEPGLVQLDVYTCSTLDVDVIFDALKEFDIVDGEYFIIDRETELNIIEKVKF